MTKLFIEDLPIEGKKVLMRVDFNVPLDSEQNVVDATKIDAALPSIQYVLNRGGSLILMSHLGRPGNAPRPEFSLAPVAKVLSSILEHPVKMAPDSQGHVVEEMAHQLQKGEILFLENLRFHRAEEHPEEDTSFAEELASFGDLYVNDAFGTAHRKHSSTYTIATFFPGKAAAGYLMAKEMRFLGELLKNPKRPFHALIGGAKISTKIGVIKTLIQKVDALLIGGGMAYTFLKAQGFSIGNSLFEEELIPIAKEILNSSAKSNTRLLLPLDFLIAEECSDDAKVTIVNIEKGIPQGYQGFDIGPKTIELFSKTLKNAKTILWNGPVGVFEFDHFAQGTRTLAHEIAMSNAVSVVGGGDSVAAIQEEGLKDKITHLSTGGGATLEFLEQGTLPGIEVLSDKIEQPSTH